MKIIVLGAGLSGLTCALALRAQKHEVCVIEKTSSIGGLAKSFRINGYAFDYGPHYIFGEEVIHFLRKILPELGLNRFYGTKEKLFFNEKYFTFPFDPKNILLNIEKLKMPEILLELLLKRLFRTGDRQPSPNVEDWVIQAVGKGIYRYISLDSYIEKLYGVSPTCISSDWGRQKLKFLAQWRDIKIFSLISKSFSAGKNLKKRIVHYPDGGGIDNIARELSRQFVRKGGSVELNSEAIKVDHGETRVRVAYRKGGKSCQRDSDFLISTIPITRLVEILSPPLPAEVSAKSRSLRYRNLLLLCLCLRRESVSQHQCVYFTEKRFLFRRMTEFKQFDRNMAPAGHTSLSIEVTCFQNDDIYRLSDKDIYKRVIMQLERHGYLTPEEVLDYHLLRVPFAYPVYDMDYQPVLDRLLDSLRRYHNLVSIGRQGLFLYNAMNKSLLESYELSQKISESDKITRKEAIDDWYHRRLMAFT